MNRAILVSMTICMMLSCQTQSKKTVEEMVHPLVGEWRNVDLTVEMDKKNGGVSRIFKVDVSTWEDSLQIRPIRTYFRPDGTFNSEHFNLNDSLVLNPSGTWSTSDNMMTMITTRPFSDTTACEYTIDGEVVTFGCWVDWDQDGNKDDWYLGTQKRFAPVKTGS